MGVPALPPPGGGEARGPGSRGAGPFPPPPPPARQRSPAARAVARRRAPGRGLWHVFSSGAAGALLILSELQGSCALRSAGVGEGFSFPRPRRWPPPPPRRCGARSPWRAAAGRRQGGRRGVCGGLFSLHPVSSGGSGPFADLLGPAEGRAELGPRVRRSGWLSSRLPATPRPACPR